MKGNVQVAQLLLRISRSYGVVWNSRADMLTMAIPDVEILAVRLFTVSF